MKKYFLLIILGFVFLWLGNYSHAFLCADKVKNCTTEAQCNCIGDDESGRECLECTPDPSEQTTAKNNCEILDWTWISEWPIWCCDTTCMACRAKEWSKIRSPSLYVIACSTKDDQAIQSSLCAAGDNGPKWWIVNSLWACVCGPGYKNVNNVCKSCSDPWVCCWMKLNTSIPFVGKCVEENATNVWDGEETWVTWDTAFPVLMWSLTKILVSVILIVCFVLIVIGGIMIASGNPSWWKSMIRKVVIGIALLWASGVILRLINPNFFG